MLDIAKATKGYAEYCAEMAYRCSRRNLADMSKEWSTAGKKYTALAQKVVDGLKEE